MWRTRYSPATRPRWRDVRSQRPALPQLRPLPGQSMWRSSAPTHVRSRPRVGEFGHARPGRTRRCSCLAAAGALAVVVFHGRWWSAGGSCPDVWGRDKAVRCAATSSGRWPNAFGANSRTAIDLGSQLPQKLMLSKRDSVPEHIPRREGIRPPMVCGSLGETYPQKRDLNTARLRSRIASALRGRTAARDLQGRGTQCRR